MKRSTALGTILLVSVITSAAVSTLVTTNLLESHVAETHPLISPEIRAKAEKAVEDSQDRVVKAEEKYRKAVRKAEYTAQLPTNGEGMCKPHGGVLKHEVMYFANVFVTYCNNDDAHFIQRNDPEKP